MPSRPSSGIAHSNSTVRGRTTTANNKKPPASSARTPSRQSSSVSTASTATFHTTSSSSNPAPPLPVRPQPLHSKTVSNGNPPLMTVRGESFLLDFSTLIGDEDQHFSQQRWWWWYWGSNEHEESEWAYRWSSAPSNQQRRAVHTVQFRVQLRLFFR